MSLTRLPSQSLLLAGPAGALEARLEEPAAGLQRAAAVICHPHPRHGGTLENKVVTTTARALQEQGFATLRFNYRGVGSSQGLWDEGRGESADVLAAMAWAGERWPGMPLTLAGFSFGAMVSLLAAARATPARLISIAPPVAYPAFAQIERPPCPWLIIQGEADELVEARAVQDWAARFSPPPVLRRLAQAGHFFHGQLPELKAAVQAPF